LDLLLLEKEENNDKNTLRREKVKYEMKPLPSEIKSKIQNEINAINKLNLDNEYMHYILARNLNECEIAKQMELTNMNNNTPSHPLLIKTFTWEKDSNELIDYESSSLRTTSYTTQTEGAFYRYDNKVMFTNKDNSATTNDHCYLSAIKVNEGNYYYQST
jgi:hypothetical protein